MKRFPMFYCYKLRYINLEGFPFYFNGELLQNYLTRRPSTIMLDVYKIFNGLSLCVYKYVYMGANSCV